MLKGIQQLAETQHISHMSYSTIAKVSGVKETTVRAVVSQLADSGLLTRYDISSHSVPRYYYCITEAGVDYLENTSV